MQVSTNKDTLIGCFVSCYSNEEVSSVKVLSQQNVGRAIVTRMRSCGIVSLWNDENVPGGILLLVVAVVVVVVIFISYQDVPVSEISYTT